METWLVINNLWSFPIDCSVFVVIVLFDMKIIIVQVVQRAVYSVLLSVCALRGIPYRECCSFKRIPYREYRTRNAAASKGSATSISPLSHNSTLQPTTPPQPPIKTTHIPQQWQKNTMKKLPWLPFCFIFRHRLAILL